MKHSSGKVNQVTSNQNGVHENLALVVKKHLATGFRKPIAEHTQTAFDQIKKTIATHERPIIFDSGCGTAMSTRFIASLYPESWVVGIDRSIVRLTKQQEVALPENALTVQADIVDFWRLAVRAKWKLQRHYILYPNPYPKSVQLKRRWHAHPVFPALLALGGQLEVRTNWKIYIDELAAAMQVAGYPDSSVESYSPIDYWTLFEKKYHENGQALYRYQLIIPNT